MHIKSILQDMVKHVMGTGTLEKIKVIGTDDLTSLASIDPNRQVIMTAKLHNVVPEFVGEFGLGNLGLLNSLMRLSNYREEDATIAIVHSKKNEEEIPTDLLFSDKFGNKNNFRFLSKQIIDEEMKIPVFTGATWNITVQPTVSKVKELAEAASLHNTPEFMVSTEDGKLKFTMDASTDSEGIRFFADNVEGNLMQNWSWNLPTVLPILKLGMDGTCIMKISDRGVMQIDIDSGLGLYSYALPANSK